MHRLYFEVLGLSFGRHFVIILWGTCGILACFLELLPVHFPEIDIFIQFPVSCQSVDRWIYKKVFFKGHRVSDVKQNISFLKRIFCTIIIMLTFVGNNLCVKSYYHYQGSHMENMKSKSKLDWLYQNRWEEIGNICSWRIIRRLVDILSVAIFVSGSRRDQGKDWHKRG